MVSSHDVLKILHEKYRQPDYALLSEVRDGTGFATVGRQMDAMAFGLWPSRGLEIIGFEIKVSRSDWLRELKIPAKAEAFYKYLDRWYIVAPEGVVEENELPIGWGYLMVHDGKLKRVVESPIKKALPINRNLLMSIVRNFDKNTVPKSVFESKMREEVASQIKSAVDNERYRQKALADDYASLVKRVKDFEVASGVKISERWGTEATRIGAAVKMVLEVGPDSIIENLEYSMNRLKHAADRIKDTIEKQRGVMWCKPGEALCESEKSQSS